MPNRPTRRTALDPAIKFVCELPELPDPHEPLVPHASSSALVDPSRQRRSAAWHGGMAAGIPALMIAAGAKDIVLGTVAVLMSAFGAIAPEFLVPYLGIGTSALLPALLALPVGAVAAWAVRRRGREDRDLGLAAAAGAGMGTTAACAGAIAMEAFSSGDLFPIPFMLTAAALAIGTVGSMAFAAIPGQGNRRTPVPSLYAGLMAAGLGGPVLLAGGAIWAGISWLFPFLSPWALTPPFLTGALAAAAAATLSMVGLAPVSYLSTRSFRRAFPGASPLALGAGLLVPPVVPFVAVLAAIVLQYSHLGTPALAVALGGLLALAAHALAVGFGLRAEATRAPARLQLSSES